MTSVAMPAELGVVYGDLCMLYIDDGICCGEMSDNREF